MNHYKRLKRDLIVKGHVIDYYNDTIEVDGEKEVVFDFVKHRGASAILPVDQDGKILMVRQYRNAIDRNTLEIPAGGLNTDEDNLTCAIRECEEETGYRPKEVHHLIDVFTTVAYCNEKISIYYTDQLTSSHQHLDEDEFITIERFSLDELTKLIMDGTIQDAKTVAGILAYKTKTGR